MNRLLIIFFILLVFVGPIPQVKASLVMTLHELLQNKCPNKKGNLIFTKKLLLAMLEAERSEVDKCQSEDVIVLSDSCFEEKNQCQKLVALFEKAKSMESGNVIGGSR